MAILGCWMSRSCSPSPTTSAISVTDSSGPPSMSIMGGHNGNHGDAMEWTEDCEKFFLEILAERVKRDPNGSPIFKTTDWIEMDEQIFFKFGLKYGPDKLKGKYHRLRAVHTKFGELINNTGVTWDSLSGQVFANDTVWDEYFKRDAIFKRFKKKGCKLYSLLTVVFSSSTASGVFHNASTYAPQTSEEENRLEREYVGGGENECLGSGSKKRKPEDMPGMRRMKKNSGSEKYEALMDAWSQSIITRKERDLAKVEKYKGKSTEVTSSMGDEFSIIDCMSLLEATPDVSFTSYNKALQFFHDLNWRKIFISMSEERRKEWLDNLHE